MLDSLTSNSIDISNRVNLQNKSDDKQLEGGKTNASGSVRQNVLKDNADGVSLNRFVSDSDVKNLNPEIISTLKNYGVSITPENLKIIAAIMKNLPAGKVSVGDLLGLMLSRKIDTNQSALIEKYLNNTVNFSSIFANLSSDAINELKASWNTGKILEKLKYLLKLGNSSSFSTGQSSKITEDFVDNLRFQELMSILPEPNEDGSIYFQWPLYWDGQDIPDCLEGEAFVPYDKDQKDSFCLRVLVNPPSLGQTEISLTTLKQSLFVHFGVNDDLKDVFKTIFENIKDRILSEGDFTSVRFSVGSIRMHKNFFSSEIKNSASKTTSKIDLKA